MSEKEILYEAECPACGGIVEFYNIGWKICPHCKRRKAKFDVTWEIIEEKKVSQRNPIVQ